MRLFDAFTVSPCVHRQSPFSANRLIIQQECIDPVERHHDLNQCRESLSFAIGTLRRPHMTRGTIPGRAPIPTTPKSTATPRQS
ncbi:hypothetical protein AKJ16_DCAP20181 [Drosera capensis]